MTHESAEKSYKKILSDYKLIQVDTPRQFNSLGQTWAMDDEIGNGFIWTYYFENLLPSKSTILHIIKRHWLNLICRKVFILHITHLFPAKN